MLRPLRTTASMIGRRTVASLLAAALAILTMLVTSTAAAATNPTAVRNHHLTLTIDDHVMEFNPEGADFSANSSGTIDTTVFRAGRKPGNIRDSQPPHRERHE